MLTHFDVSWNDWDDEPSPMRKDLNTKVSHRRMVANSLISEQMKGKPKSEITKKRVSASRKGIEFSSEHKENLKKQKLINKITSEQILQLQKECNTAKDVAKQLGITWHTYKRIATELGVYKKMDLSERNKSCGNDIFAWKYDASQPDGKGEFIGEYKSLHECARELTKGAPGGIGNVLKGKAKQSKGYYFEYKLV